MRPDVDAAVLFIIERVGPGPHLPLVADHDHVASQWDGTFRAIGIPLDAYIEFRVYQRAIGVNADGEVLISQPSVRGIDIGVGKPRYKPPHLALLGGHQSIGKIHGRHPA